MQREKFIIDEILEDGQKIEINKSIADKRLTKLNLNNISLISLPPPFQPKNCTKEAKFKFIVMRWGKRYFLNKRIVKLYKNTIT